MNVWSIAGNVGSDAETKTTQGGTVVTSWSVAVDVYEGAGKRGTLWVRCTMFGDRGAKLAQYIRKGGKVAVSGECMPRAYKDKQGDARVSAELTVRELTLMSGRSDGGGGQKSGGILDNPAGEPFSDDEIPF